MEKMLHKSEAHQTGRAGKLIQRLPHRAKFIFAGVEQLLRSNQIDEIKRR
jgi:hypothetical protein